MLCDCAASMPPSRVLLLIVCCPSLVLTGCALGCLDGGHTYHVRGTLVDQTDNPIPCAVVSALAVPKGPIRRGYPAVSAPIRTDAAGSFVAETYTRGIVWGTCGGFGPFSLYVPPPPLPELDAITLELEGVNDPLQLTVSAEQQKRAIRTQRWIELGTVKTPERPPRVCCPALGEHCPLPPEKLRP